MTNELLKKKNTIYENKLIKILKKFFYIIIKALSLFVPVNKKKVTLIKTHESNSNVVPLYNKLKRHYIENE